MVPAHRLGAMALPDQFEAVGVVVGSMLLVALPVSVLVTALVGLELDPRIAVVVWFTPGLVIGVLLARDALPIDYGQLWVFALSSWILTLLGWVAVGLSFPPSESLQAVVLWVLAIVLGAYLAYTRPIRQLRAWLGTT